MEQLGKQREDPIFGGTYTYCPADTIDDQIQCIKYEACNNLWCRHCGCGFSDICDVIKEKKNDLYPKGS